MDPFDQFKKVNCNLQFVNFTRTKKLVTCWQWPIDQPQQIHFFYYPKEDSFKVSRNWCKSFVPKVGLNNRLNSRPNYSSAIVKEGVRFDVEML